MSTPLHQLSLAEQLQQLQDQTLSAADLVQHYLDRAAQNKELGAFLSQKPSQVQADAHVADAARKAGQNQPLLGLPLAYSDRLVSQQLPTTAGSLILSGYASPFDAAAIEALSKSGAVTLGKTNVDAFGLDAAGCASDLLPTSHPFDPFRPVGAAESGAASAVAAGLAPAAVGVDCGGSLLRAAGHTGLTAIRPSYGRASRFGIVALVSSVEQTALLAHSAADCGLLLPHISAYDPERDATSLDLPAYTPAPALNTLAGLTLGVPQDWFAQDLSPAVQAALAQALEQLQAQGAKLQPIALPQSAQAGICLELLGAAEATSNLSRYDGVRFGQRATNYHDLESMYENTRSQGFNLGVQEHLVLGNWLVSEDNIHSHYEQAQKVRRLIAQELQAQWAQCDFIVTPLSAQTAPEEITPNQAYSGRSQRQRYSAAPALAGLPALALPVGLADGLPTALQVFAPYGQEAALLQLAAHYQAATDNAHIHPAQY